MTLFRLCQLAEQFGIEIDYFTMRDTKSLTLPQGWIALDTDHIESTTEAKVCLAHEMGHIETNSFYNVHSPLDVRQKHENRANKWAIKQLITEEELDEAVANGHTEIWDLADYFDVTEEFMRKAVCLYTYGNLATELYF